MVKRHTRRKSQRENSLLLILAAISIILSSFIFLPESLPEPVATPPSSPGIHWHAHLQILVNGMDIPIPTGVGITEISREIQHTHDWDGIIHIETIPIPANLRLGKFFDIWGVPFSKDCLFQYCGFDMTMEVNGKENNELDNYLLQDGDEILIEVRTF